MQLYQELAPWWQQFSPTHEYQEEAAFFKTLLAPARTVLELGCGGGNVAFWLKGDFQLTLTDLSEPMLANSRRQNPECEHLQGDMRTLDLGRTFDAVLIHDAIMYMLTVADLRLAIETAKRHSKRIVIAPDHLLETFEPGTECGGEGDIRWLEWTHDRAGTTVAVDYVLALREGDALRTVVDRQQVGVFGRDTWIELLSEGGYTVAVVPDPSGDGRRLEVFLACADF